MPRPLDILDQIRTIMDEGHIVPSPANYDFLHRYVMHSDQAVWSAIDEAIRAAGHLSAKTLAEIQEHAAKSSDAPGSASFLSRVEKELGEVRAYLTEADGSTRSYRSALKQGQSEFDLVESTMAGGGRAGELLAKLAAATDTMMTEAAALNAKLESSGEQVAMMHQELEKARRDTLRDALTGLPNRRAFDMQISDEAEKAAAGGSLTVAFCDVDHFKKFNDTWGHRVGDDVLRLVGVRMIDAFKDHGFAARYGGEEFVALLPGIKPDEAQALADSFRKSISARTLKMRGDGRDIGRVTVSVGLATWFPGETTEAVVERADSALYQAKREGRDRVVYAAGPSAAAMSLPLAS